MRNIIFNCLVIGIVLGLFCCLFYNPIFSFIIIFFIYLLKKIVKKRLDNFIYTDGAHNNTKKDIWLFIVCAKPKLLKDKIVFLRFFIYVYILALVRWDTCKAFNGVFASKDGLLLYKYYLGSQGYNDITNIPNAIVPSTFGSHLVFRKVGFAYPTKKIQVISNCCIEIKPNQMVAFVGYSGSGKTTLIKLLSRMYDPQEGCLELDGMDIRKIDVFWYRKHFALVRQDVEIFDGSIKENIKYPFPTASDDQVKEAARASHLEMVLENKEKFPEGLATQVGERGIKLSGGECQRVGIARAYLALLGGAKVLLLDEATSNLDSEAEQAVQNMLAELRKRQDVTIVVIAHRLSTIFSADYIYVIDNGNVVG